VRDLLSAIPDWRALIGASGIDPLNDFSAVLIATPNLIRESVVIAGRLTESAVDPAVLTERLIRESGAEPSWRQERGAQITTWPSPDPTPREVALVGPRRFILARPRDIPRVLAIATARRARRGASEGLLDALLALPDDTTLSVEVENVAMFVRRSPCAVPRHLEFSAMQTEEGLELVLDANFERADDAQSASTCLRDLAQTHSRNYAVIALGLTGPLDRLDAGAEDTRLALHTRLLWGELRTLLSLARSVMPRQPP
jgi:hypothetical protein